MAYRISFAAILFTSSPAVPASASEGVDGDSNELEALLLQQHRHNAREHPAQAMDGMLPEGLDDCPYRDHVGAHDRLGGVGHDGGGVCGIEHGGSALNGRRHEGCHLGDKDLRLHLGGAVISFAPLLLETLRQHHKIPIHREQYKALTVDALLLHDGHHCAQVLARHELGNRANLHAGHLGPVLLRHLLQELNLQRIQLWAAEFMASSAPSEEDSFSV
eukprot:CAMPEP_0114561068 /NCGR_PEP_ID=MMETSP0114-20121206/11804_1 /TAXON_ID=31324 /ORGANISM="Goniomonas sp, Strain m" /LENGTH=217 /DNA_ID=CAMNT_0001746673 /DNA_START=465 /DNA_END=1120 /DNA_ORIENTATION=-